jgi:NAD-dependent deacetylase
MSSNVAPSAYSADSCEPELEAAGRLFRQARRVLVITGAGMSADSGLPTYRGVGGLYDSEQTEEGIAIEEALSGDMFKRDPAVSWKHIAQIEQACRGARPNAGHHVLAEIERHFDRLCVLTQNVDGFHRAAGSRDVIEMHGSVHRLYCTACAWSAAVEDYARIERLPPLCEDCGGIVRPDVVLFGEMLPARAIARYERALLEGFDLVVVVGTTAVFPYIAAPVEQAVATRRPVIEINPQDSAISHLADVRLRLNAAEALGWLGRDLENQA